MLGQLLWLAQQSKPDVPVGVSMTAQTLNKLADMARRKADLSIVFAEVLRSWEIAPCPHVQRMDSRTLQGEKHQCGLVIGFIHQPELVKIGRFDLSVITSWQSATVKKVVRSTMAADGSAVSEGL